MHYYTELPNFPKDVLNDQYKRPVSTAPVTYWNVGIESFRQEAIDFFLKYGLEIQDGEMFRKMPDKTGAIHSDIIWNYEKEMWVPWYCAINLNLDDTASLMYWMSSTATEVYPEDVSNRLQGIHYGNRNNNKFNTDEYKVLDVFYIHKPTLVRTHIPHTVKNIDIDKDRWCLSIRFKGNPTYEECLDRFEKDIKA
jgi:hypothetical protein